MAIAVDEQREAVEDRDGGEGVEQGLNIGLMGMIVVSLVAIGILQAVESFNHGFWSARSLGFYQRPPVRTLLWLRMIPDTIFIAFGATPLVAATVYVFLHMRPLNAPAASTKVEEEEKELVEV